MARKSDKSRRSFVVRLDVNPARAKQERDLIDEAAKEMGISRTLFVRKAALEKARSITRRPA